MESILIILVTIFIITLPFAVLAAFIYAFIQLIKTKKLKTFGQEILNDNDLKKKTGTGILRYFGRLF